MDDKRLFLIDGYGLAYRAYYAMMKTPLSNSKGQPTGAVLGFTNYILRILQVYQCPYLAVIFDSAAPTFRKELYAEYKANRAQMPDDLRAQIPLLHTMVKCLNIPCLARDGFEADDIIATLTKKAAEKGFEVFLITKDKDLMQLVSGNVTMLQPETGSEFVSFGPQQVKEKMGVEPERIRDLLALMGDSSDNIPGIPGVGPKTALKILSEADNVEKILADPNCITTVKLREKVKENIESLRLSNKLVALHYEVETGLEIDALHTRPVDRESCVSFLREMEFVSLLKHPLFDVKESVSFDLHVPQSLDELDLLTEKIFAKGVCSVDTETTSLETRNAELVGISIGLSHGQAWYIPVGHALGNNLPLEQTLLKLRPVLESASVRKAGQNLKYDYQIFRKYGIKMDGIYFDTMLAAYLIDPGKRQYNLDALALQWLNVDTIPIENLIGKGKTQISFSQVEISLAARYSGEDAVLPLRLADLFIPILEKRNLMPLFESVEMPLLTVLAEMEWEGVAIDTALLANLSMEYSKRLNAVAGEIYALAGAEFNLNSPKQISDMLFDKLKLPVARKTKTGISTDVDTLEQLAGEYPIAGKILEYREMQKLLSTYIDALPGQVNQNSGRVHTSFNQTVAATGRLSSTGPNLQNIPIRTEAGRRIREAFVAPPGHVLLSADYSQIELRLLAHMSEDSRLVKAFVENRDIHTETAAAIYSLTPDQVTQEMRRAAKTINFGLMYGMGPINLSRQLGISFGQAQEFIRIYFAQFPTIQQFIERSIQLSRERGYAETLLGRRRYVPDIDSENRRLRDAAERIAVNTPVQGTAADIIKIAMINIHKELPRNFNDVRMILQVHDELVFEVPQTEVDSFSGWVVDKMSNAYTLSIPLKVDTGIGANWSVAH